MNLFLRASSLIRYFRSSLLGILQKSLMSYVSSLVGLSRLEINAEADGHIGIELDEDVRHSVPTQ